MSVNSENIKYNDYKNICRTCLMNSDLISIQENDQIIEVLNKLTGIRFETNDNLPQQICFKCYEKINEIHEFSMQCIQTYIGLKESLNNEKTIEGPNKRIVKIKEETQETNVVIEETTPNISKIEEKKNKTKIHSGEHRPYICDICNQGFSKTNTLFNHRAIHIDERPFKCNICAKTFKLRRRLQHHMKVHSGERPYKCPICPKTFTNSSNLLRHKMLHSGERPHKCNQCEQSFTALSNLRRHFIKIHEPNKNTA